MAESTARRQEPTRAGIPGIEFVEDVADGKQGVGRHQSYAAVLDDTVFRQVDHGYMSHEDAERAWQRAVREWDLMDIDSASLKTAVAAALLQASSQARDYSQVAFSVGEEYYAMNVIAHSASLHTDAEAAIRVWARSYNHAEIPCRMSDILGTAQNNKHRQQAAYRYNCSFKHVKFAFDLAVALLDSDRKYTHSERTKIKSMRAVKTTEAEMNAKLKGLAAAPPDSDTKNDLDDEHVLAAPSESRTRFASMK